MTAREMFEKLGYSFNYYQKDHCLIYSKFLNRYDEIAIIFDLDDRDVEIRHIIDNFSDEDIFSNSENTFRPCFIYMSLLKAINKQCEELGWFEDE